MTMVNQDLYRYFLLNYRIFHKGEQQWWELLCNQFYSKHTTALFSLSDHYILSWEWRDIADQVQTIMGVGLMVL